MFVAKNAIRQAIEKTSNCGLSGSNAGLLNVANNDMKLAKGLAQLAAYYQSGTDSNGQLSSHINQVSNGFDNIAIYFNRIADSVFVLADNFDSQSYSKMNYYGKSLNEAAVGIFKLAKAMKKVDGPPLLIFGIRNALISLRQIARELNVLEFKLSAAVVNLQNRCDAESNVPDALNNIQDAFNALIDSINEELGR